MAPALLPDRDERNVCSAGAAARHSWKGRFWTMNHLTFVFPMVTCALAGASAGCAFEASVEPPTVVVPSSSGTVTLRWTVANRSDPSVCSAYAAPQFELVVYDASSNRVATATAPCAAFNVTLPLPEGTYSAEVTLVDFSGNARSTTRPLHAIEVVRGTDLAIDVDFPPSSML